MKQKQKRAKGENNCQKLLKLLQLSILFYTFILPPF